MNSKLKIYVFVQYIPHTYLHSLSLETFSLVATFSYLVVIAGEAAYAAVRKEKEGLEAPRRFRV